MNRREFLCASAGAACALAAMPAAAEEAGLRVALIGCGPRGLALADTVIRAGGCPITVTWDVNPALAQAAAARHNATAYPNLPALLASASPEIAIVTGQVDVEGMLDLLRSGVHLYLDTVPTASVAEGTALRQAAASSGQVVQVNLGGPAQFLSPEVTALLRSERIGRVSTMRAHVHHFHPTAPRLDRAAVFGWAGEILTLCGEGSPGRVTATGHEQDCVITWELSGRTAIWEQRTFTQAGQERVSTGATYYGSEGVLRVDGDAWRLARRGDAREECGTISGHQDAVRWAEFIRAIREQHRSRRSLDVALNAAEMVRLAECSRKLERPLEWDSRRRLVPRDAEANRLLRSATEWPA